MAYDDVLAARIREVVAGEHGLSERQMFGGLAFLLHGNMAVAASSQGGLLLRVDPRDTDELVQQPSVERFVMRGRAMDGWLHVAPDAVPTEEALHGWVARGLDFARGLPPK